MLIAKPVVPITLNKDRNISWKGAKAKRLKSSKSITPNSESIVIYVGNDIYGVKWRNWKMMTKEVGSAFGEPAIEYPVPLFFDLHINPREEHPLDPRWWKTGWVRWPAGQVLVDHMASLKKEPPIRPGTPDPYVPPKRQGF